MRDNFTESQERLPLLATQAKRRILCRGDGRRVGPLWRGCRNLRCSVTAYSTPLPSGGPSRRLLAKYQERRLVPVRMDRGAPQGPGAGARTGRPGWHVEKRRGGVHEGAEEEPPQCLWGPFHSREQVRPAFAQVRLRAITARLDTMG